MTPTNAVEDTAKCCRIFLSSLDESLCFTEIKLDTRGTWKRTQLWWGITNKTISNGTCALRSLVGNPKSWRLPLEVLLEVIFIFQLTHREPGLFLLSSTAAKRAVQTPNYPCSSKSAGISKLQNRLTRLVSACKDFNTCIQVTPQSSPKRWIWQDTEVPSTQRKPDLSRCCQPWRPNCLPPGLTPLWKCPGQKSWRDEIMLTSSIKKSRHLPLTNCQIVLKAWALRFFACAI